MKSRRKASSSRRAEGVVAPDQRVALLGLRLAPERRDLDDLAAEAHVAEPEAPADDEAVAEQALHLLRVGVGADVEVLRAAAEQQVAHAAPHQVGQEAVVLQAVEDLQGIGVDVLARDGVLGARAGSGESSPGMPARDPSIDYGTTGPLRGAAVASRLAWTCAAGEDRGDGEQAGPARIHRLDAGPRRRPDDADARLRFLAHARREAERVLRLEPADRRLSRPDLPVPCRAFRSPCSPQAASRKGIAPEAVRREALRRGAEVLGYAVLFRLWMFTSSGFAKPADLLRVDVLNCIGCRCCWWRRRPCAGRARVPGRPRPRSWRWAWRSPRRSPGTRPGPPGFPARCSAT